MKGIEQLSSTFQDQADKIKNHMSGFHDHMDEIKQSFNDVIVKVVDDSNKHLLEIRKGALEAQDQITEMNSYLENHLDELKRHDLIMQSFRKSFEEIYSQIQTTNDKKVDKEQLTIEITKLKKDIMHIKYMNEDTAKTLNLTDNYIQKYLPLKLQNQILKNTKHLITAD